MPKYAPVLASLLFAVTPVFDRPAQAQITATPNDANTLVNQTGNTFDINGGTQAGANLYHSFQQFGLNQGQIANFLSNGSIQNILARVTGGQASVINGLIQVTGGTSNLYLMNPAGIVFGAGASLNVPGSFTATTANGIGFNDGKWLNAIANNDYQNLSGTPDKLAFTMSQPGAIVNAGNLTVDTGNQLVLAGGTVVSTAPIATNGRIMITTVPGSSLVRLSAPGSLLSLEIQPITSTANLPSELPANWSIPSLPQLLTGGSAGNAYGLTVDNNGQVTLTGSGVQINQGNMVTGNLSASSIYVSSTGDLRTGAVATSLNPNNRQNADIILISTGGKIIVDTIRVRQEGFTYDGTNGMTITVRAFDVFQANGTFLTRGRMPSNLEEVPTSIITQGKISIEHSGQTFQSGLGLERDASGNIVYRTTTGTPVFVVPNTYYLEFRYADGTPVREESVTVQRSPFNPTNVPAGTSYTTGAMLIGAGVNAQVYETFQNQPFLPDSSSQIQVSRVERALVPTPGSSNSAAPTSVTPNTPVDVSGSTNVAPVNAVTNTNATTTQPEVGREGQTALQRDHQNQNPVCESSNQIASSPNTSPTGTRTNTSCNATGDNAPILKILGD